MQTLQFTAHIENNAQVNLTLPFEYANQLADDPLERPAQLELNDIANKTCIK